MDWRTGDRDEQEHRFSVKKTPSSLAHPEQHILRIDEAPSV